ncbi:homologous-pairing protein 2 homolog [Mantella aurantiaca]
MIKSKDGGGASTIILKYLNNQNRPYSTQDVFSNLQREHGLGKTAVVKAMEQLAQQGNVKEKVYGKQKIYFANQEQFPNVSDLELKNLDAQISELSSKLQGTQQSCRQLESELKDLNSSMTTEEMLKEIKTLKEECSRHQEKLQKIKSATNHVTPEEKEKVYNDRKQFCKEWKKRKRMAMDIFDAILEGYPKSKKQFYEEVGVETDEDHNVTLPDI